MATVHSGFDYEVSCQHICNTYQREKVYRVPIMLPINWQLYVDIDSIQFGDWHDEERYHQLARSVHKHCEPQPPYNKVEIPNVFEP